MSLHLRALPTPLPATPAGPVLSLTAHAALLGAVVAGGGPAGPSRDDAPPAHVARAAAGRGERLHWVGIGEGPGDGTTRPGERPPSAYVIPGRRGALGGAAGGGARDGAPPGSAPADRLPPLAPVTTARSERAVPDLVLPDVTLPDVATTLVAGVLSAAPDLARSLSRPEDFTRLAPADGEVELDAPFGALALTAARSSAAADVLPVPLVDNPRPSYPRALERARVEGRVVVEFRIDSVGAVDPASLRVVTSTDARFTDAVRGVLPRLRFVPAQLREHSVGVTVRQPFVFRVVRRP